MDFDTILYQRLSICLGILLQWVACNQVVIAFHVLWKEVGYTKSPGMKPDWHSVNRLISWKWEKRELNKRLSKTLASIGKRLIGL